MTYLFLSGQPVRAEINQAVADNLVRKGWTVLPDPPDPAAEWDGTQWVMPPAPPPTPEWVAFGAALAADPDVNQLVAVAAANAPVLHLMLGVGLGQAAQGDPRTFSTAWAAARGAGLVAPALVTQMQALATSFSLPADFVAGLGQ